MESLMEGKTKEEKGSEYAGITAAEGVDGGQSQHCESRHARTYLGHGRSQKPCQKGFHED